MPYRTQPEKRDWSWCGHLPTDTASLVRNLVDAVRDGGFGEETCDDLTIAVSEALNNIAEHAYKEQGGDVTVQAIKVENGLCVRLSDTGIAMPGGQMPLGTCPTTDGPVDALPEGGFGWFMLRELTENMGYERDGGSNHLTMTFATA